jgi:quercetin dioxygenase-like cupin family protein
MDRSTFEQGLREHGYSDVVDREMEANKVNADHSHEFDARLLVLDGEMTLVRNGAPQTYRSGDTFEVPAGTIHEERFGPSGCRYIAGRRHAAARA